MAETRRRLRHARAVRRFPAIGHDWARGAIDRCHITTLMGACTVRTSAAFEAEHPKLLEAARSRGSPTSNATSTPGPTSGTPTAPNRTTRTDEAAREVHLSESFDGMWFGRMTFDAVNGTIVNVTLEAIEQELFEADWAEAKERLGREPLVTELGRTPAQRRADAMVEMAIRARTAPADGRRPAPLFTIVCGLETLTGPILELWNRTVITPGTAARWLTAADVERIVFESPSRVIDVGATRRFFTGALRRAIEVRDRTCFHRPVRRTTPATRDRPHHRSQQGRAHHPDQRPPRLRLPQPLAQPPPRRRPRPRHDAPDRGATVRPGGPGGARPSSRSSPAWTPRRWAGAPSRGTCRGTSAAPPARPPA